MRKFTPLHLHVVRMYWEGIDVDKIALKINKTVDWVKNTVNSEPAKEILAQLQSASINTMTEVQTVLQAAAPLLLNRKIDIALHSGNDAVANKAAQELLELAGHVATRQVEIRRPDHVEEEFRDKSEADIRRLILQSTINSELETPRDPTDPPLLH